MLSGNVDKLLKTFLISPTAGVENSFLNLPVLLPSSQTETTVVISKGNFFKPRIFGFYIFDNIISCNI